MRGRCECRHETGNKRCFSLNDEEFFVPEHFTAMGALGALYAIIDEPGLKKHFLGLEKLNERLNKEFAAEAHEPLSISKDNLHISYDLKNIAKKTEVFLGVDVGSISTNLVVMDKEKI